MATRMYNIVARYAEISGVKSLWPSKFELYFECDKCGHSMELPIKWDDKEYKLRTEKLSCAKCVCGKWIKIKKVPEVVSEDDFVKGYFKESDLPTDVCATIQVVGGFELRADLFVGVGQGIVWKTHLNDKQSPKSSGPMLTEIG